MKISWLQPLILFSIFLSLPACDASRETPPNAAHPKVTVTTLQPKTVTLTQSYVCQIQSHQRIVVRAPETGYLAAIPIREGQTVKRDDLLFQVKSLTDEKKLNGEDKDKLISVKAPFDGVIDRLPGDLGRRFRKGEPLTNLFDNSQMWVYFNVPEVRYLAYKAANLEQHKDDVKVELVLANGDKYDHLGKLGAIGTNFHAGSVAFRADFPNPRHLLRHGATGTVLISQVQNDLIVVPQRATFEVLDKQYVYVVGEDNVAHQREIAIQNEWEDQFVVKTGVGVNDKIVVDGARRIRDGEKVEYEGREPKVIARLKKQGKTSTISRP